MYQKVRQKEIFSLHGSKEEKEEHRPKNLRNLMGTSQDTEFGRAFDPYYEVQYEVGRERKISGYEEGSHFIDSEMGHFFVFQPTSKVYWSEQHSSDGSCFSSFQEM